jgi:hypothetical protein
MGILFGDAISTGECSDFLGHFVLTFLSDLLMVGIVCHGYIPLFVTTSCCSSGTVGLSGILGILRAFHPAVLLLL